MTRRITPNQHRHEGRRKINTSAPTTPQQLRPKINATATATATAPTSPEKAAQGRTPKKNYNF